MTKSELIKKIKENGEYNNIKDAEKALSTVLETIKETLATGEKVQLVGFGTFEVSERAAREGRKECNQSKNKSSIRSTC